VNIVNSYTKLPWNSAITTANVCHILWLIIIRAGSEKRCWYKTLLSFLALLFLFHLGSLPITYPFPTFPIESKGLQTQLASLGSVASSHSGCGQNLSDTVSEWKSRYYTSFPVSHQSGISQKRRDCMVSCPSREYRYPSSSLGIEFIKLHPFIQQRQTC